MWSKIKGAVFLVVAMILVANNFCFLASAEEQYLELTDAIISEKSESVEASINDLDASTVRTNVKFTALNDYVEYKFQIKNRSEQVVVVKQVDVNGQNDYIRYELGDFSELELSAGDSFTLLARATYVNQADISERDFSIKASFTFAFETEDEGLVEEEIELSDDATGSIVQDNADMPNTIDRIGAYVLCAVFSLAGLIIALLSKKKAKSVLSVILALSLAMGSLSTNALSGLNDTFNLESNYQLRDRLLLKVEGEEYIVSYGDKIPVTPSDIYGYAFVGWEDADGEVYDENSSVYSDLVLTEKRNRELRTVNFIVDGNIVDTKRVYYGDRVDPIDMPTKEGYYFEYWREEDSHIAYNFTSLVQGDLNLIAAFQYIYPSVEYEIPSSFVEGQDFDLRVADYAVGTSSPQSVSYRYQDGNGEYHEVYNVRDMAPGNYMIEVIVTDNNGYSAIDTADIEIIKMNYSLTQQGANISLQEESTIMVGGENMYTLRLSDDYYLTGWTCSDGYEVVGLSTGKEVTGSQDYTIRNNDKEADGMCSFTSSNVYTLYEVASLGDYVYYRPTASSYTPVWTDEAVYGSSVSRGGEQGELVPNSVTNWRVLSKNSDGTIDIIPAGTAGSMTFSGADAYAYYSSILQSEADAFMNNTFAKSSRAIKTSDVNTIKNRNLTISTPVVIDATSKDSTDGIGGVSTQTHSYYYVNTLKGTTIEENTNLVYTRVDGKGINQSTNYEATLALRPIVTLKAGVLENGGNGSNSSKAWKLYSGN